MKKIITIDGNNINDISSFYKEINKVFMQEENWQIGESLDALNDMLYGGFGAIKGNEEVELIWKDFSKSRNALGLELTKAYYKNKLEQPSIFDVDLIKKKLTELENGTGKNYFDIILEIIEEHQNIKLIPQ